MRFDRIGDAHDARLAAVETIYLQAIPASERKPVAWLSAAAGRADFRLTVATAGQSVVGFALGFVPPAADFALLEYLAVARDHQNRGAGGGLFDSIFADGTPRTVLAEVETADTPDRQRRQSFYRRHGCREVGGLDYQLPLDTAPPPMRLSVAHAPEVLSRDHLRGWLTRIYTDVYGVQAGDPRIDQMLRPLPDPVILE